MLLLVIMGMSMNINMNISTLIPLCCTSYVTKRIIVSNSLCLVIA